METSDSDGESERPGQRCDQYDDQYEDYYQHATSCRHLRPITVTEGVDLSSASLLQRAAWWLTTLLNLLRLANNQVKIA